MPLASFFQFLGFEELYNQAGRFGREDVAAGVDQGLDGGALLRFIRHGAAVSGFAVGRRAV